MTVENFHFLSHRMRANHSTMETDSSINAPEETAYHVKHSVPGIAAIGAVVFPHSTTTQAQNIYLLK